MIYSGKNIPDTIQDKIYGSNYTGLDILNTKYLTQNGKQYGTVNIYRTKYTGKRRNLMNYRILFQ